MARIAWTVSSESTVLSSGLHKPITSVRSANLDVVDTRREGSLLRVLRIFGGALGVTTMSLRRLTFGTGLSHTEDSSAPASGAWPRRRAE